VSTGKLRYVVADFPIESIHPQAFKAHEATHCAGDQGKYWEMYHRLFGNQRALGAADLLAHADALSLKAEAFKPCVESGKYAARVQRDLAEGRRAGVTGTPTFFLGWVEPDGTRVRSIRRLVGAQPYDAFKEAIEAALSAGK